METFAVFFFIIIIAVFGFSLCRSFYHLFDHCGWKENSNPNARAEILNISSEKVQYVKNGKKYKTTVVFSDGFYFVTHKTNREDYFFTYEISVDEDVMQEIIAKARKKHEEAVNKYYKNM